MYIPIRIRNIIIKVINIGLIISTCYFLFTTVQWMTFEKYQLDGSIKGIDEQVDKDLGLDKMTDLAYEYEKAWLDAEEKHCLSMAAFSFITFLGIKLLRVKPEQQ